jgi:hypothetical protein
MEWRGGSGLRDGSGGSKQRHSVGSGRAHSRNQIRRGLGGEGDAATAAVARLLHMAR